jgi:hypothetical protein
MMEKAPEGLVGAIDSEIFEKTGRSGKRITVPFFTFLFKPAFAGVLAAVIVAVSVVATSPRSIGFVENLSDRFKLPEFENVKPGDMLYTGNNTVASIRLQGQNTMKLHQNTVVKFRDSQALMLSRGEISLVSRGKELMVETPNISVKTHRADTRIVADTKIVNGQLKSETICFVFSGTLTVKTSSKEMTIGKGQKIVVAQDGITASEERLTASESESGNDASVKDKVFAAIGSLCDCVYAKDYNPDKWGKHKELFGGEVNENSYKVRVFWQEKGLNKPFAPLLGENGISLAPGERNRKNPV